jgi:hypothetical protein
VYHHYEVKEKFSKRALILRLSLALVFLFTVGFAGGVLYLLLFLVPFEQWLVNLGTSQGMVDALLSIMVVVWILIGLCATAVYWRTLLTRRRLLAGIAAACVSLAAAGVVFFFLLDQDFMAAAGQLGQQSAVADERLSFGSYPDERKIQDLQDAGYDGVISLLSPKIPFERVLLDEEIQNGKDAGIAVYSEPMLPWIGGNHKSVEEIKKLVAQEDKQFYIHCYLGKHRVDLVRQELKKAKDQTQREVPLPDSFERGRLVSFDNEHVILGPYPTDEEWFEYVLRRDVKEVVSTLDPKNPDDRIWIEKERKIAEENDVEFTLKPLDPSSPEAASARAIARYASTADHKVYVHDFLSDERFEALDAALREQTAGKKDTRGG